MISKNSLISLWSEGVQVIDPIQLFDGLRRPIQSKLTLPDRSAVLCWGKAAFRTWDAIAPALPLQTPALVIGPKGSKKSMLSAGSSFRPGCFIEAEHPLPGPGSLAAGHAVLDFFDSLRRLKTRKLEVYLSGGASSLAWVPPAHWSAEELGVELQRLYSEPLSIEELNRKRSKLCALKGGGAGRWLHRLAPEVRAHVSVLSDVAPHGPEVVGSGPFWDGLVPHQVVADNAVLVRSLVDVAKQRGLSILEAKSNQSGSWSQWVEHLSKKVRGDIRLSHSGLILWGGEPQVNLSQVKKPGKGGRQSQIGAALMLAFAEPIAAGRIELLCMSSDGVDGRSGSAGTQASVVVGKALLRSTHREELFRSIQRLDSASVLRRLGALVPESPSGTNVQDVVLIRVQPN